MLEETEAVICTDCPRYNFTEVLLNFTEGDLTLRLQVTEVSSALAVITVAPGFKPVTVPLSSTTAILFLLLFQTI
jgi:hypothetical protein